MAKGVKSNLTDEDVGLIKAMLATGEYNRQQILSHFSRPDRTVNPARINEIDSGEKRADVPVASAAALAKLLAGFKADRSDDGPMSDAAMKTLLWLKTKKPQRLVVEETQRVEFKQTFGWSNRAKYARTIAGFANNQGGYLLFGVKDDGQVVGIMKDTFEEIDPSIITRYLDSTFQPQIIWRRRIATVGSKKVGVLWIEPCQRKPVVCSRADAPLKEGDIYFRYIGETRPIGYAELMAILDERDRNVQRGVAAQVSQIAEIGTDNAGVLDTATGKIEGHKGQLLVDGELLKKVRFITEGSFDDTGGHPTLKVIGDVMPVGVVAAKAIEAKGVVTNHEVLVDFIQQKNVHDPAGYVRHIVNGQMQYLPIFYYIHKAGMSMADAITLLANEPTTHDTLRTKVIARVTNRAGHLIRVGPSTKPYRDRIMAGKTVNFRQAANRCYAVRALQTIPLGEINLNHCLRVLHAAIKDYDRDGDQKFLGDIRYSAAHVDAAGFAHQIKN